MYVKSGGAKWHYIAKTILVFVLAYRQQDPVIVGIMEAQFIKIDVEENIAGLEFCWLLWKAVLVFCMAEKVIWVTGKHFCIILLCCCCPVGHLLFLYTATEVMKNILQTIIVQVPNHYKVSYKSSLKPVQSSLALVLMLLLDVSFVRRMYHLTLFIEPSVVLGRGCRGEGIVSHHCITAVQNS